MFFMICSSGKKCESPSEEEVSVHLGTSSDDIGVVFLSQMLLLFKISRNCKGENVLVETQQQETIVTIRTNCSNPNWLEKESVWQSQRIKAH